MLKKEEENNSSLLRSFLILGWWLTGFLVNGHMKDAMVFFHTLQLNARDIFLPLRFVLCVCGGGGQYLVYQLVTIILYKYKISLAD